jgi:hypothetical protein
MENRMQKETLLDRMSEVANFADAEGLHGVADLMDEAIRKVAARDDFAAGTLVKQAQNEASARGNKAVFLATGSIFDGIRNWFRSKGKKPTQAPGAWVPPEEGASQAPYFAGKPQLAQSVAKAIDQNAASLSPGLRAKLPELKRQLSRFASQRTAMSANDVYHERIRSLETWFDGFFGAQAQEARAFKNGVYATLMDDWENEFQETEQVQVGGASFEVLQEAPNRWEAYDSNGKLVATAPSRNDLVNMLEAPLEDIPEAQEAVLTPEEERANIPLAQEAVLSPEEEREEQQRRERADTLVKIVDKMMADDELGYDNLWQLSYLGYSPEEIEEVRKYAAEYYPSSHAGQPPSVANPASSTTSIAA